MSANNGVLTTYHQDCASVLEIFVGPGINSEKASSRFLQNCLRFLFSCEATIETVKVYNYIFMYVCVYVLGWVFPVKKVIYLGFAGLGNLVLIYTAMQSFLEKPLFIQIYEVMRLFYFLSPLIRNNTNFCWNIFCPAAHLLCSDQR